MRSYTHIAGAILLFITFAYLTNLNNILSGIFFAGWISVFPDIIDRLLGKHRGYGHSLIWLVPFTLVGFLDLAIAAALIIGFISHILLDILTVNGCPVLYPFWKTNFVCFSKGRRIKTGTNQDKAVFVFILFLLIPVLLFTTSIGSMMNFSDNQNLVFAAGDDTNTSKNNDTIKNTFNLNFELDQNVKKNITVEKISENKTTITIT
ncbi:MAG TPA: metal-dependent hydrolase [Methanobacterium sp.]|nr:MAG: metal-dependent hydrolase [Methanobacterium sp.]HOI71234.1 metal-dependent hydrolase [Methanobacterium sp.]